MARAATISNGNLLVGLDYRGQVRDIYYPYVGHEYHVSGSSGSYTHRIGVYVDGKLSWQADGAWALRHERSRHILSHVLSAKNESLGIELQYTDVVHNEKNVFLRKITVSNEHDTDREVKIFFGQEFRISESRRGDTAFYDPRTHSIIHYKGAYAFLIHASADGVPFGDYSVGLFDIEGKKGTYTDAEDGILSKNQIEHGSVDSVIGIALDMRAREKKDVYYWIVAAPSIRAAHETHGTVLEETPERLIISTERYWTAWTEKECRDLSKLSVPLQNLYKHSLAIIRAHTDNRGGIIASSDSEILNQGRDAYVYVWPRDAALAAHALDRAGYFDATQEFFSFMTKLIEKDGYLMHKYRVDGALGSSWHPWMWNGSPELPIQEDETAIVLYTLMKHYERAKDIEFIEEIYNPFVEVAADFLSGFIEKDTGLPTASYDLWEEKFGTSTYTTAAVYGALMAAAELSALLGKRENAGKYRDRAYSVKQALVTHLYDADLKSFVKLVRHERTGLVIDKTIDLSSLRGILFFGVLDPFDKRVEQTALRVESDLRVGGSIGGYMRYAEDRYYRCSPDASPNPWCITTLWVAQYYISIAKSSKDLQRAYRLLEWVDARAGESGMLPEQVNPQTGAHLSASPLVWSHAEYVITVDEYLKKLRSF